MLFGAGVLRPHCSTNMQPDPSTSVAMEQLRDVVSRLSSSRTHPEAAAIGVLYKNLISDISLPKIKFLLPPCKQNCS